MFLSDDERREYEIFVNNARDKESEIESGFMEGIAIGEANKEQYAEEREKNKAIEVAKNCLRNIVGITSAIWRCYFSLFQGAKTALVLANKAFCNDEIMEKNKSDTEVISTTFLNMGMSISDIAKITGLTDSEISSIIAHQERTQ